LLSSDFVAVSGEPRSYRIVGFGHSKYITKINAGANGASDYSITSSLNLSYSRVVKKKLFEFKIDEDSDEKIVISEAVISVDDEFYIVDVVNGDNVEEILCTNDVVGDLMIEKVKLAVHMFAEMAVSFQRYKNSIQVLSRMKKSENEVLAIVSKLDKTSEDYEVMKAVMDHFVDLAGVQEDMLRYVKELVKLSREWEPSVK